MTRYVPSQALREHAARYVDMVDHLVHLQHLASHATSIVEFGIRSGVSTWALLDGLPYPGTYLGIDNNPATKGWVPDRIWHDRRAEIRYEDDRETKLPAHADLVMIDSSHEYEHTLVELDMAAAMTPDVIVLHDYLFPEPWCKVKEAVDRWVRKGPYRKDHLYYSHWGLLVLSPKGT